MSVTIKKFLKNEFGSVTTDWVVLVASLILMGVLILAVVTGGAVDLADDAASVISAMNAG